MLIDWFKECAIGLFMQGFCVSLVRPGILVFLALVLFGFGRGIGLPILFWRPKVRPTHSESGNADRAQRKTEPAPIPQFLVGIGIGALVWQVLLAGYLFEEFATNYTLDRPPFCEVRNESDVGLDLDNTKVPKMESWDIPGYRLDFPAVDRNFSHRFRYDPLSFGSLCIYSINVLLGGLAIVVLVIAVSSLLPALTWLIVRSRKLQPAAKPAKATARSPLPISIWLPLGLVVGAVAGSVLTCGWFQTRLAQQTGQVMTTVADWGTASGRQAMMNSRLKEFEGEKPIQMEAAAKAKSWFAPYYHVYGAFVLNFALIFVVSIAIMWFPKLSLFSPAVGIVLLLNVLIFSSTLLNYFSPVPGEFVSIVLIGIVILSGRAYKIKFPNMGELYRVPPLDLNEFYQRRAEIEAQESLADASPTTSSGSRPVVPHEWPGNPPGSNGFATESATGSPSGSRGAAVVTKRANLLKTEEIPFGYAQPKSDRIVGAAPKEQLPRLAIVCVSGGGSRAAAWTMKSLLEIEKAFAKPAQFVDSHDFPPLAFPYQVRLVSGASGGMIAASYYVASLDAPNGTDVRRNFFDNERLTGEKLFDGVCHDFLTPITHTLVSRDLPSLFVPTHLGRYDRGTMMEEEWKTALHGQLDQTFAQMLPGEKEGWRPSLIFSPMMIEDGRQLFISNLDLARVVRNSAMILGETGTNGNPSPLNPRDINGRRLLSREGMEFFKAFPDAKEFRLSTAARMSATFPYILPAAYLPTNPPRRVVDAGYYDNYGVGIAASWLFNHMEWIEKHTSGVVVIQIRDGATGTSRRREEATDSMPSTFQAGLHWLTGPPQGLWSFREAAHTFRNDNQLHLLADFFDARKLPSSFLTTVSFEFPHGDDVALNFTLTEGERTTISNGVESPEFKAQVCALLKWWHQPLN